MKLKVLSPKNFGFAGKISQEIQTYLPNLIETAEIFYAQKFDSILEAREVEEKLEEALEANWKEDIIINLINGLVNYQGMEINVHAYPLNAYTRKTLPALFKIRNLKKGGHIILGNFVQDELKENVGYLAKLGVEQFHKMLGILPHNKNCFSFFNKSGVMLDEDVKKDFCPQCKEFMARLTKPLDYKQISKLKREIFPESRKRYWEFKRLMNEPKAFS